MNRRIDEPEALAVALFAAVLAHLAPALAAVALTVAVAAIFLDDARACNHARMLLALAGVTAAGFVGGPSWAVAAALCWRLASETRARGGSLLHAGAAPLAALLWRLDAPQALTLAAACAAAVAWADWAIARLAEWRLNAPTEIAPFVGAQASLIAPLALAPTPGAALAGFVAMALVRTAPATPATSLRYALT